MFLASPQLATSLLAALPPGGPTEDGGTLVVILFYLFAAAAIAGALAAALLPNPKHAAAALLLAFAGLAGLYFILQAEFLAAIQLLVFLGGSLAALFITQQLLPQRPPPPKPRPRQFLPAILLALVVAVALIILMIHTPWQIRGPWQPDQTVNAQQLGHALISAHAGFLIPLELVSALMLPVLIGAAYFARERRPLPPPGPPPIKTLAPSAATPLRRKGRA